MLQIKKEIDETILLEAGEDELAILISTFEVVMNTIRGGFHARIGADREEVQALLLLIQTALRTLKFQDSNIPTTEIQVSVEDLRILVQILNEACNGIFISNFEAQTKTSEETLNSFLRLTGDSYRAIRKSRSIE
jgi:hypothetical protein